jgi:hypothetical protein
MKVISFDVGIKNMAYCILDIDISSNHILINSWNIINLLEENPVHETCTQIISGKTKKIAAKPCTKQAKYKKSSQCFCDKHAKSSTFIIPTKKTSITSLKKMKVDDLIKLGKPHFLFSEEENIPKLKKDILNTLVEFYEKQCLEAITKIKSKNASELDLITIGKNMKDLLNKTIGIDDIDLVLIENQISPIANRMKTVQGMLAQYFIMKNSNIHIEFVSSANKLSQFKRGTYCCPLTPPLKETYCSPLTTPFIIKDKNIQGGGKGKSGFPLENILISDTDNNNEDQGINPEYKQHKKDGLYYCTQILENNAWFMEWKSSLQIKKADDLADCFLQGLWYFKNKNIITYADDLKIIFV